MAPELHEKRGKIIINTIRRLYRRNSRVTNYKLIQKTHPTDIVVLPVISSLQKLCFQLK